MIMPAEEIFVCAQEAVDQPANLGRFKALQAALGAVSRADFTALGLPEDTAVWGAFYDLVVLYGEQDAANARWFLNATVKSSISRLDNFKRRDPSALHLGDLERPDESWTSPPSYTDI